MQPCPEISVILPVFNEADGIEETIREVVLRLGEAGLGPFELLAVNDGSTDATEQALLRLADELPALRVLTLSPNAGQSAAMGTGFRWARGKVIVTMDADGQNDPADIPACVRSLTGCDCCFGYRARRRDTRARRWASRVANAFRNRVLHEDIVDTGCSLKAFKAEFTREIPVWDGMHRFLGSMVGMQGARIVQVPVNHRPRTRGRSKYTNVGRLKKTIWDLLAVRWMKSRARRYTVREMT